MSWSSPVTQFPEGESARESERDRDRERKEIEMLDALTNGSTPWLDQERERQRDSEREREIEREIEREGVLQWLAERVFARERDKSAISFRPVLGIDCRPGSDQWFGFRERPRETEKESERDSERDGEKAERDKERVRQRVRERLKMKERKKVVMRQQRKREIKRESEKERERHRQLSIAVNVSLSHQFPFLSPSLSPSLSLRLESSTHFQLSAIFAGKLLMRVDEVEMFYVHYLTAFDIPAISLSLPPNTTVSLSHSSLSPPSLSPSLAFSQPPRYLPLSLNDDQYVYRERVLDIHPAFASYLHVKTGFWRSRDIFGQTLPMALQRNFSACTQQVPRFVEVERERDRDTGMEREKESRKRERERGKWYLDESQLAVVLMDDRMKERVRQRVSDTLREQESETESRQKVNDRRRQQRERQKVIRRKKLNG
jgi:hypothetical protein